MSTNRPITVLAFDYGSKTVGVASGQSLTGTASEIVTLRHNDTKNSRQQLFRDINKIIQEWRPDSLVIGWPLNMDGSESEFCQDVKKFAAKLEQASSLPVNYIDERLSSREAKSVRQEQTGQQDKFRQKPVDALAAKILLESWFNQQDK